MKRAFSTLEAVDRDVANVGGGAAGAARSRGYADPDREPGASRTAPRLPRIVIPLFAIVTDS